MNQIIELYEQAFAKAIKAASQSHFGHWDPRGTRGLNCPECVRARKLRAEAEELLERAHKLKARAEE